MKKLTVNTLFRESFNMEERSNNTHTNDRTKRGLLQHLNFCRQKNRHEGDT